MRASDNEKKYSKDSELPNHALSLTRLRLWGCGAIFAHFFQGKIGLRSQNRRAAYAIVSVHRCIIR